MQLDIEEKSLNEIKRDIALVTLDIESLGHEKKEMAILHLKETIDLLQLGSHNKRVKQDPNTEESPEKKIKLDPEIIAEEDSSKDWLFNEDTFENMNVAKNPVGDEEYNLTKSLYRGMIPSCDICASTFVTVGALDTHMKANHADIKLEESFKDASNEHVENIEEMSLFENTPNENEASISIKTEQDNSFIVEMDDKGFYNCQQPECDSRYTNRNSLKNHLNIHTDKFKCSGCQQPFMSNFFLKAHNKNPANCEKILSIRTNLRQKKASETQNLFKEEVNDYAPVNAAYDASNENPYNLLEEVIEKEISEHLTDVGEDSPNLLTEKRETATNPVITCEDCGREYTKRDSYMIHRNVHTDRFKCQDECQQRFQNAAGLKKHNCKTVRGRVPPKNQNFSLGSSFQPKDESVTSLNSGSSFCDDTDSEKSQKGNSDEKFQCGECGKEYTNRNSYMIHYNIHTDKFKCEAECQQRFSSGFKLRKHDCQSVLSGLSSNTSYPGLEQSTNCGTLSHDTSYQSQSFHADELTIDDEPPQLEVSTSSNNDESSSQEDFDVYDDQPPQLEVMTTSNDGGLAQQTQVSRDEKMFVCEAPGCGREFAKRDTFTRHKHEHTDRYKCERCSTRFSGLKPLKIHACEKRLRKQREAENNPEPAAKRKYRRKNKENVSFDADTTTEDESQPQTEIEDLADDNSPRNNNSQDILHNDETTDLSMDCGREYTIPDSYLIHTSNPGVEQSTNCGTMSEDDTSYQSQSFDAGEITIDDEPPHLEVSTSSNNDESSYKEVFDIDDSEPPQLEVMTNTDNIGSAQQTQVSRDEKIFVCKAPGCGREFAKRDTFTRHKHEHTDRYKCDRCSTRFSGMKPLKAHNCDKIRRKRREAENNPEPAVKRKYRRKNKEEVSFEAETTTEEESKLQTVEEDLTQQDGEVHISQDLTDNSEVEEDISQELVSKAKVEMEKNNLTSESAPPEDEQMVYKQENLTDGSEQGLLKCHHCQRLYSNPVSLRNHLVSHSDRFRCSNCDTGFISKVQLDKHDCETVIRKKQKETKQPEKIYECDECGMRFGNRGSYREHKIEHTGQFRCSLCQFGFSSERNLESHSRNPLNCKKVQSKRETSRRKSRLLYGSPDTAAPNNASLTLDNDTQPECVNQGDEDDDDDMDLISCEVCGKYFVSQDSLENHKSQCGGEQAEKTVDITANENLHEEPQHSAQAVNMSPEENIAYFEKQGMAATIVEQRQDVEITMTAGPGTEDINMLQQSYPGISFIPKIKSQ